VTSGPNSRPGYAGYEKAVVALFFVSVFCYFTYPIKLGDFWWHINTGRWIWEHRALPHFDPFTYTTPHDSDPRRLLVLRGYWLAQIAFYALYKVFGYAGPILLKAGTFAAIIFVLWKGLTEEGLNPVFSLLLLAPLPFIINEFEEVRPQIFSFLGALLVYRYCLKHRYRQLVLVMLVWANVHRGYIIGMVIIAAFMAAEVARYFSKKNSTNHAAFKPSMLWLGAALAASFINPNFTRALTVNMAELSNPATMKVSEYKSLWEYWQFVGNPALFYATVAFGAFSTAFVALSFRSVRWHRAFLFIGFTVAGLMAFRFSIFFVLMTLAIASPFIAERLRGVSLRVKPGAAVLAIALSGVILFSAYNRSFARNGMISPVMAPVAAAGYLSTVHVPGPVFNAYEYGGYLSWRLYPEYEMFIDPRYLDFDALADYREAKNHDALPVLDKYGVNSVVFYSMNPITNEIPKIIVDLQRSADWELMYLDPLSVIFVRAGQAGPIPALSKQVLWDDLEGKALALKSRMPSSPEPELTLGRIYTAQERWDEALAHYRDALKTAPGNAKAEGMIKAIEKWQKEHGE